MSILVGGSVAIDNVKTPSADEKGLLGGSASYAALAAAKLASPVHLLGIVGHDFPADHLMMLEGNGVDLGGLEHSSEESFTWSGEYHENMNERTTHNVAINVLEHWEVKVPDAVASSPFIVLANMAPLNQLQLISQCTASEKFVVADTMDLWIAIARDELEEVMAKIDLLVINEGEAREYAGTNNLILAGERLREKGPQYVVIKLGEFGALLFGENEFFRCGAWPLRDLEDPTGAGDTFLGGMIGHLASRNAVAPSFAQLRRAVVIGSILASYTCQDFSTRALEAVTSHDLDSRMKEFELISQW
ncbi:PfkB family carbohydrate kinase [Akkermansiaceae bacterium]|nr:PfkB family carbohydrate kinase [Akkermansiaceae bacterium]MDB4576571.1 PfkB family carbohydrate kinase [Akkermansiaceae bacterium]MDC0550273.1 PfkB family carbohydrate kinase [bacterium]